ncbi:lytic transglycosylase domain-containing protein [Siccibacter colletis]|uniref:lytic transglycosylase domain-containing protein n=1 Tax=Siccibacter colletis TaxID=1505757 RepID=UPI0004E213E7|nr:transglycosylase SLT domain-containing protein [Siccibacter colletis]
MQILSGPLSGPVQPQLPFDISALSGKPSGQNNFSPLSGGGPQAVSWGNNQPGGTDLASLMGNGTAGMGQNQNNIMAQFMSELIAQIMQALLPMLQQMMNGQQNSGSGAGGSPSPSSSPAASASAPQTPPSAPAPTPQTAQTPQAPQSGGAPVNYGSTTPTGTGEALSAGKSGLHLPPALQNHEEAIMEAANHTGIEPEVLAAQIWQESRGKADAVTVNGGNGLQDSGVMQVNQNTFAELQRNNSDVLGPNASPSNPRDSIMAGALYMKEQKTAFGGDMGAALRAYNSGPGNVNINDLTDISKTGTGDATYVDKVQKFAEIIKSGNGTLPA